MSLICISAISAPILKHSKGLVVNYGERGGGGGATREGVQVKFYPYEKGVGGKSFSHIRGDTKQFWGSFITGA